MTDTILTDETAGVLTITLNRPDAMNAFVPAMLDALAEAVNIGGGQEGTRVVVLRGAGRAFSAGVDLKVLQGMDLSGGQIDATLDEPGWRVADAVRRCPVPVIASVHGYCFTGALELALMCDLIYVTEGAKLGDTHARFGLRPSWGMSQTLPEAVGMRRARELSYTARTFTGAEAAEWGLAQAACTDEAALDALVAERAGQVAANSAGAVRAYRDLHALAAERRPLPEAVAEEVARSYDIQDTEERLAAFKRG